MPDKVSTIIVCVVVATLVPIAAYVFLKKRYHVTSQPFWLGVVTFVVFALLLERLALNLLYKTDMWVKLLETPLLATGITGLIAGIFEESGCLISMKVSAHIEKKNKEEELEENASIPDNVRKTVEVAEHERNHALLHGLGHGGAVVFVFVISMVVNLIYTLNEGSVVFTASQDPIDNFATAAFVEAAASMQGFHPVDFIYTLIEEIAALGIHISLAIMVWLSMRGSRYTLFFPLSILLHAFSDILVEVLQESGLSEAMCVVFFVAVSLVIVEFTYIVWSRIKFKTVLDTVKKVSDSAE